MHVTSLCVFSILDDSGRYSWQWQWQNGEGRSDQEKNPVHSEKAAVWEQTEKALHTQEGHLLLLRSWLLTRDCDWSLFT